MAQLVHIVKKEDEGRYVKEILTQRLLISSRLLKKIKITGDILLNGKHVNVRARVYAGDKVEAVFPDEESYFEPENIPLDVIYEDDDLLVVNKQAGLIVHPTYNFPSGTLANALTYRMRERGEVYKLRFVNRLDMYTSGLLIVAKNAHAQDFISHEMNENRVVKNYMAIVHGVVEENGTIHEPIGKDPNHVARRIVTPDGYDSITHYRVEERFPGIKYGEIEGFSLLDIKLDTGRTHQIRVHMTHIGHPLVGDELYAQLYGYYENPDWMPRQALHAYHLEFMHPTKGRIIKVSTALPQDMKDCLKYIKEMK